MLDALEDDVADDAAVYCALAAPWVDVQLGSRGWNPAVEASTVDDAHATMLEASRVRSHARATRALAALVRTRASVAETMVPWLLPRLPGGMSGGAIAEALLAGPPTAATSGAALRSSLAGRPDDGLVAALCGFAHGSATLREAAPALRGPTDVLLLLRLALRKAATAQRPRRSG